MRTRNTLMTLAAALLLTGPAVSAALAQTTAAPPAGEGRFARLDTNGDGFIDTSEAKGRLAEHFDQIDADHDGRLSRDELKAAHHGMKDGKPGKEGKGGHLAMLDTDHDGKVSWAEFTAGIKSHFDQLDANRDGYLDATELRVAHRHGGHHGDGAPGDGHWGAPDGQTPPPMPPK